MDRLIARLPCAWGENWQGQLGDGTTMDRDRPIVVQGVLNAIAIAAKANESPAVSRFAMGSNPIANPESDENC